MNKKQLGDHALYNLTKDQTQESIQHFEEISFRLRIQKCVQQEI
jgi:hypothetical protein